MGKNDKVKVSVIVPVYNASKYLFRQIRSVQEQTMSDFELIMVNDGSTDQSLEVINEYAAKDSRIKVISKKNEGVSKARNVGLDNACGKYAVFFDADDFVANNMLEVLYCEAEKEKADIVSCGHYIYWPKTEQKTIMFNSPRTVLNRVEALRELVDNHYIGMSSCSKLFLMDRIQNIRFSEEYHTFEDRLFIFDAIRKSDTVVVVSDAFYYYCMNEDSVSHASFSKVRSKGLEVMDRMYAAIKEEYPEIEPNAYADRIRMKYVVLGTLYEDSQWMNFLEDYNKLVTDIREASLHKSKRFLQKTTYYQMVAIKYAEPFYRIIKTWYIDRQKRSTTL